MVLKETISNFELRKGVSFLLMLTTGTFLSLSADNLRSAFFGAKLSGSYTSGLSAARILPSLRNHDGNGNENVKKSTPVFIIKIIKTKMHTSRGTLLVALLFALTAWLRREIESDVLWSTQTQDDDFFFWT